MSMDAMEMQKIRDANNGVTERAGVKTENVIKMFGDPEKIKALKASTVVVTIGTPATEVIIKPLNPKLGVEAYRLLRTTMMPIIMLYKSQVEGNVNFMEVFDAFGENVDQIPKLIHLILSRGNPSISLEWVENNLDLVPDLLTIIPPFMEQNMFDTLFSPKARVPQQSSLAASESANLGETKSP